MQNRHESKSEEIKQFVHIPGMNIDYCHQPFIVLTEWVFAEGIRVKSSTRYI